MMRKNKGFTLIELLVVAAVLGVLAAIAAANFTDAFIKAKVARVNSDLRALATAIEVYRVNHGTVLITDGPFAPGYFDRLQALTTPVVYINRLPTDPFQPMKHPFLFPEEEANKWQNQMYIYNRGDAANGASHAVTHRKFDFTWSLTSTGPDQILHYPYYFYPKNFVMPEWYVYDNTNGIQSGGDIFYRSINATP